MPQSEPTDNENQDSQDDEFQLAQQQASTITLGWKQQAIRWISTGGSGFLFVHFLLNQQIIWAIPTFLITLIGLFWTTYTKSFAAKFQQFSAKWGDAHAQSFGEWLEDVGYRLWFMLIRPEDRYLQCQSYECSEYTTEGWKGTFTPDLAEVFVPLDLMGTPMYGKQMLRGKPEYLDEGLSIWKILTRLKKPNQGLRMAILSPGGYGKTTLLRHITHTYATKKQGRFSAPRLLPVLLYLRRYQETLIQNLDLDLSEFIEQHHIPKLPEYETLKLPQQWAKTQLLKGKLLVMFDGFDEVKLEWREPISLWIGKQVQKYPRTVFIVTSRPAGFDDFKADNIRTHLQVREFSQTQQEDFIRQWYRVRQKYDKARRLKRADRVIAAQKADSLISQIKQDKKLQKLAKKPLELNLLINLHYFYPNPDELPKYQIELYKEIISLQLGDRPIKKKISMGIKPDDAQRVLQKLALFMFQQEGTKSEISTDILLVKAKDFLEESQENILPDKFISKIEKVSELIVRSDENYQFSHLSFQAYLAALEIRLTHQENLLFENWQDYLWKETIKIYGSVTKTPSVYIRQLRDIDHPEAQKLADACLREIPDERVDPDLKQEIQALRAENFLFQQLEKYLTEQNFRAADQETDRVMLQIAGKESNQYLSIDDIKTFPCKELRIIDDLWKKYSNGKFGFSVQKQIWLNCGGVPGDYDWDVYIKFATQVSWYMDFEWCREMNFSMGGVQGHLPSGDRIFSRSGLPFHLPRWGEIDFVLFSRMETCEL